MNIWEKVRAADIRQHVGQQLALIGDRLDNRPTDMEEVRILASTIFNLHKILELTIDMHCEGDMH